jgi:Subtilase family
VRARFRPGFLFVPSILLALPGCGGRTEARPPAAGGPLVVMVMDQAFDETLPAFQGKIAGTYTMVCAEEAPDAGVAAADGGSPGADGGPDGGVPPASFGEAKAALLAELARPDDTCHLQPGVAPVAHPLDDLEPMRKTWNAALLDDQLAIKPNGNMLDPLFEMISDRLKGVAYHGTATAGLIAEDNPDVALVLVSRPLATPAGGEQKLPCITQDDLDQVVALLRDPEVRAAYVGRPISSADRDLYQAMRQHGVRILNESFGRQSRFAIESALALSGCRDVSLAGFFAVTEDLDAAQRQAHMPPSVLVVKAAGNDGARVTGPGDSLECHPGDQGYLLVGSYGLEHQRSSFSNFGPCVDAYAPGEMVIAPLPGDWLYPLFGTSLAAPLVSRWLAMNAPAPFDLASARAALLALREPSGNLPLAQFPAKWIYDPRAHVRPVFAQKSPALALPAPLRDPWFDRRKLWPIRAVRRSRGLSDL